jgi:hypothetical protein
VRGGGTTTTEQQPLQPQLHRSTTTEFIIELDYSRQALGSGGRLGSGPAVAALCRLGDLHAPGEGATDGSLSTVLQTAVGFDYANVTAASFLIFPWRRVEWIRRDRSRERGRHQVYETRMGEKIVFYAAPLCAAVPSDGLGYTGSDDNF